jgi:hypothetical protein
VLIKSVCFANAIYKVEATTQGKHAMHHDEQWPQHHADEERLDSILSSSSLYPLEPLIHQLFNFHMPHSPISQSPFLLQCQCAFLAHRSNPIQPLGMHV